jgi:hypothetical protein
VSRGSLADLRVRRRLAEISDRLAELRARSHEVSNPGVATVSEHERLARAAERASQAQTHAVEAARLARQAYRRSAEVHDRVADLYEQLALTGAGDVARYERQAERHRRLAEKDRLTGTDLTSGATAPGGWLGTG